MVRRLGKLEAATLALVQMRTLTIIESGYLTGALSITAKQERELFSRMARSGMIAKVRNGLYLFPQKLPVGGVWTPDEAVAINALMADKKADYQIAGPSAFNRYGYSEQIPARLCIYNTAISGQRRVGSIQMNLVKVERERLGDTEQIQTPSGQVVVYSSRVRTLVDAVYDWSRFDSLPEAYDWIRQDMKAGRVSPTALINATIRYSNVGTARRIGALLELAGVDTRLLGRLQRTLSPTTAKIPFIPTRAVKGTYLRRWGVVVND